MIETVLICIVAATGLTVVPAVWWHWLLEPRHLLLVAIAWLAVATVSFVLTRMWVEAADSKPPYAQIAVLLGVVLGTAGWIVSSESSIRIARKKHTIDLVADYLFRNSQLVLDKKCLAHALGVSGRVTPKLVDYDDSASEIVQALDRLTNFAEFLAAAILSNEIDEPLAKDMLRPMICHNYVAHEDYILHWRRKNPNTWRRYADLYVRWRMPSDPNPKPL